MRVLLNYHGVSGDASKGVIRQVSVSGAINLVDTRGHYYDVYDRVGVKITTGGAMGALLYILFGKKMQIILVLKE